MKCLTHFLPFVLVCLACIATTQQAPGQRKKPPEGKVNTIRAHVIGTIVRIQGETILAMSARNEKWVVHLKTPRFNVEATITVEGTAVVEALRPGVFVRFTADVDKRGNVQGELTELSIFYTPTQSAKPGMFPNDGEGDLGKGAKPGVSNYLVIGRVTKYQRGRLSLAIPGTKGVRANLADDIKLSVRSENYRLAGPGDKISAKGFHLPGQKGTLNAQDVKITLVGIVGETAKAKKKRELLAKRNANKQPGKRREFGDLAKDGDGKTDAKGDVDGAKNGKKPKGEDDPLAKQPVENDEDKPLILIIN